MTADHVRDLGFTAIKRFRAGDVSYPVFILELERAVDAAEEMSDKRAQLLRRSWGELEIINALSDGQPKQSDRFAVDNLIAEIEEWLKAP